MEPDGNEFPDTWRLGNDDCSKKTQQQHKQMSLKRLMPIALSKKHMEQHTPGLERKCLKLAENRTEGRGAFGERQTPHRAVY